MSVWVLKSEVVSLPSPPKQWHFPQSAHCVLLCAEGFFFFYLFLHCSISLTLPNQTQPPLFLGDISPNSSPWFPVPIFWCLNWPYPLPTYEHIYTLIERPYTLPQPQNMAVGVFLQFCIETGTLPRISSLSVGSSHSMPLYYKGLSKAFKQEGYKPPLCVHVRPFSLPPSILLCLWVFIRFYAWIIYALQVFLMPRNSRKCQFPRDWSHHVSSGKQTWVLRLSHFSIPTLTSSLIHSQNSSKWLSKTKGCWEAGVGHILMGVEQELLHGSRLHEGTSLWSFHVRGMLNSPQIKTNTTQVWETSK